MLRARSFILTALVTLTASCPDPAGRFDEFVARVPDAAVVEMIDAPPLASLPDVTGTFFGGLATTLDPNQPIMVRFTNVLTPYVDGTGTLDTTIVAIAVADKMPVGPENVITGVPVNVAGEFEIPVNDITFPGAANPITGSTAMGSLVLRGRIRSEDRMCGDVSSGMVTSPIVYDLTGSTWSVIRVADGAVGDDLPSPPERKCPEEADAGVPDAGSPDAGVPDASPMPDAM